MIARAGQFNEPQVAFDHDHLGQGRDRRQAEPGRDFALGHLARAGEARLLRMLDHQLIEAAGIGQHAAHDQRVGNRHDPIGKPDRAIRREQADLGQLAAEEPLGCGGIGMDFGELYLAGAAGEELDD